jgi:transposase-like protein
MPRTRSPYPPEFRQQMVALVRAGRTSDELARDFELSAETIRIWLKQADRDDGCRHEGLTTVEREGWPVCAGRKQRLSRLWRDFSSRSETYTDFLRL